MDASSQTQEIDHTYAFVKTGGGNRYLRYAEAWGGFYIGFEGFPLELATDDYDRAKARQLVPEQFLNRSYFGVLRDIYCTSLPQWRSKIRLATWNRASSCLEIWQATGELQPFPRRFLPNLFDECEAESELEQSGEWQQLLRERAASDARVNAENALDWCVGASGYRFLPAKRLITPIPSETLYAPIDTLSVLQQLNRRTFAYMTAINPPGVPWPEGIFQGTTTFLGPDGSVSESGYGRFVRQYLDSIIDPGIESDLHSLTIGQRMTLVCATLNPMLIETAAMLFALDLGMTIDSGRGKGRQGIDVVAVCGRNTCADDVLQRLKNLGICLHPAAAESLRITKSISFQCKGNDGVGLTADRLVEFRPMSASGIDGRNGISLQQVLTLADRPDESGLHHLHDWLSRMCDVIFKCA
jgi:hypothetical protein